jgi:hypothetical protein
VYWLGNAFWGPDAYPDARTSAEVARATAGRTAAALEDTSESHLHSWISIVGYHIRATDGEIGHVDDFIVDDRSWAIRYFRVDTSNWIGGQAVVVPQRALADVNWGDSTISVKLTRDKVWNSPHFDSRMLNREYDQRLDSYYDVSM